MIPHGWVELGPHDAPRSLRDRKREAACLVTRLEVERNDQLRGANRVLGHALRLGADPIEARRLHRQHAAALRVRLDVMKKGVWRWAFRHSTRCPWTLIGPEFDVLCERLELTLEGAAV